MEQTQAKDRPPVLLLHGWGGSFQHTWVRLGWVSCLESNGYRVIEQNLPGHGVPEAPHDPQAYANILDDLYAQVGHLRGVTGFGYSLGAKLMLALAARHPDMFNQLVVLGIGDNAFKPLGASKLLAQSVREMLPADASPALVKLIDEVKSSGNDLEAMAACITRPQEQPLTEAELAGLDMPILIVNGSKDQFALPQERLVAALPKADTLMFDGFDHVDVVGRLEVVETVLKRLNREPAG